MANLVSPDINNLIVINEKVVEGQGYEKHIQGSQSCTRQKELIT